MPNAHGDDVNVISWNSRQQHLLASGGDDGVFRVWDLRSFRTGAPQPVAEFKWHSAPVTSIEWHPSDSSVLLVTGADDQTTLWDMAVEADPDAVAVSGTDMDVGDDVAVPPQLLFVHQGQTDVKEAHWHPQIPGLVLSTAASGFNVFKTISA